MRNRVSIILAVAAFALSLASCQKEEKGRVLHFVASIDSEVDNGGKTILDGTELHWTSEDCIAIYGQGGGMGMSNASPRSNPTWADFNEIDYNMVGDGPYAAIYPACIARGGNTVELPDYQQSLDGSLTGYVPYPGDMSTSWVNPGFPMYARSNDENLAFKNLCGALKIHLQKAGVSISRIQLVANAPITGTFGISMVDGVPQLAYQTNGGHSTSDYATSANTVDLICHTPQDITEGGSFYIYLPAGSYSFQINIYASDGRYCSKSTREGTSIVIERSKYSTLTIPANILNFEDIGALSGMFTVYNDGMGMLKQVYFSKGNLQYTTAGIHAVATGSIESGTWRFAEHQYDFVGGSHNVYRNTGELLSSTQYGNVYKDGVQCSNSLVSSTYTGWIDLFGWATSGYHNNADVRNLYYQPYSTDYPTTSSNDYNWTGYGPDNYGIGGTNYDWGVYNAISNGGDEPGMWRTLTSSEWDYLLNERTGPIINGTCTRFAHATVNGVDGVLLFPDTFIWPTTVTTYPTEVNTNYCWAGLVVSYSAAEFQALESSGCVFLPIAGHRQNTAYEYYDDGTYWSSTGYNGVCSAAEFSFRMTRFWNYLTAPTGLSVRLVRNAN